MKIDQTELTDKILGRENLSREEGLYLYSKMPASTLLHLAHHMRQQHVPGKEVGWIIDRNVNITNVCISFCSFCNFCRQPQSAEAYITEMEEYDRKIGELFAAGGRQVLLQGGLHPRLGLAWYADLFRELKSRHPDLKLHALGPPEVVYLAKKEGVSYRTVLETLTDAGLDSLPGAGAEILVDRVRKLISPAKASTDEWLEVMAEAHRMNLPTSATMMYGHLETPEERMEHLFRLRDLQAQKPGGGDGFITFVPWPFQSRGTRLAAKMKKEVRQSQTEYLRLLAVSRLILHNIKHLQTSLLTVGKDTAQVSLHGGADDVGSVMMEENVVSAAGNSFKHAAEELKALIREAGFRPRLRDQRYQTIAENQQA